MRIDKKNKPLYYLQNYARFLWRAPQAHSIISDLSASFSDKELEKIKQRVDYYNQLSELLAIQKQMQIRDLKRPQSPKAYYFDTYEYARYFDENLFLDCVFGDVVNVPPTPSIVKSRPIVENNQNSILLNLDKARHFVWIRGDQPFQSKKNQLVGRGAIAQQHRYDFYAAYFNHPLCDLGQTNTNGGRKEWIKPKMPIKEHLDYKFILSLQGNDVATNLKWVMSSNSIAVMPKPTVETWFMEGTLEGGKHYIELKPDYSDLEAQLEYYTAHPELCLEIIGNAHQHCQQFWNPDVEKLCSLLVLEKYFQNVAG
ncbi:glycosyl transferase family 90 [Riemerella columbina]|uniref:glycosyl transferase family 90 n=1 Tax=Riemerella columbina TaxID=103810 RepID=UPI00266EF06D|nr:glycosyl transferase family 90 [Riemerella columbina]WKS95600.1 glycosyltransferase family 90 protein [Riemerella columbina]